ncbi:MAG: hypothetical protein AB1679_00100 [Actinomycetota bacterium]
MNLLAALIGAGLAGGLLLVVSGLRRPGTPTLRHTPIIGMEARRRFPPAAGAALLAAAFTRWPVAAVGAGIAGWCWPELFGGRAARERAIARTEAIATWTEMLRDTISGAHGLEETIVTTATVAPAPIRQEVSILATRLEQEPLDVALRSFADDLCHPTGDLVVAALTLAARGSVGELGELLSALASTARDEAAMRLRVEASRSRLRTAVRVIALCTATTAVGLILLNRSYVAVYGTAIGQTVLAFVALMWGVAFRWLAKMSEFVGPERFLTASAETGAGR